MKKKLFILTILLLFFAALVFVITYFYFPKPNRQVYKNCTLTQSGMTYAEVVEIMGKPASEEREDNKIKLLYLAGGVQTETGVGFEFKDGFLITKDCGDHGD